MDIELWENENNNSPAKKFLSKLDPEHQLLFARYIQRFLGFPFEHWLHNSKDIKHIKGDLYEIKVIIKDISLRCIGIHKENIFYVLDIFKKKTQKIELKYLKRCRKRLKEFKLDHLF